MNKVQNADGKTDILDELNAALDSQSKIEGALEE